MQQIYLKRLTKQDITKSVAVCTESVNSFWGVPLNMTSEYVAINICHEDSPTVFPPEITIHKGYNGEKDWRICGNAWKSLYAHQNPQEGDIMRVKKLKDGSFMLNIIKQGTPKHTLLSSLFVGKDNYVMIQADDKKEDKDLPLQKITYGAPGTGKSNGIKKYFTENNIDEKTQVIRTTFHPDSDYSTFVGAYKPTMEKKAAKQPILNFADLVDKLKEYKQQQHDNATLACTKFGFDYHDSLTNIREDKTDNILNLVKAVYDPHNSLDTNVRAGKIIGEGLAEELYEEKIVYKFVPQAFLKAYVAAWKNQEQNMFLVIEEINRGNCAQIFGDIFQLLDRNDNGESEYPIKADQDIQNYLAEVFADCDNLPENIKSGEELILPSNLYIWATMNTSDQSLFPIDSAFKRRWDWEYVPIKYANDNWIIEVGQKRYYWVSFQKQVNEKVYNINHSEDKMLGDFFVKADKQDVITESVLLNKILFYLWNDVCKDGEGDIFKKDANTDLTFSDLYGAEGTNNLIAMMTYLGVEEVDDNDIYENDGTNTGKTGNKHAQYSIEGSTKTYRTPKMVQTVIQNYANNHLEMSVQDMIDTWSRISGRTDLLVESYVKSPTDNSKTPRYREIKWDNNTKSVWVVTGWTKELGQAFAEKVKKELGITIEMVN